MISVRYVNTFAVGKRFRKGQKAEGTKQKAANKGHRLTFFCLPLSAYCLLPTCFSLSSRRLQLRRHYKTRLPAQV